jgi:hypothetical protein
MSDDFFGQLCFFTFVEVPTIERGVGVQTLETRLKRVKLATIHCKRSDCEANVDQFKTSNPPLGRAVQAEFSFRECL